MMDSASDDLECEYYVANRIIDGLRAGASPVPKQVIDWCLKTRLKWEVSADGPQNDSATGESDQAVCDTAHAGKIIGVSERHTRRLAETGHIDGQKFDGGVWALSIESVMTYAEERRKWSKPTRLSS